MPLQLFGTPRCQDTKKAQRFFKERGLRVQFIDLSDKGISPGELRAIAAAVGLETLADRDGKRWRDKGLDHLLVDLEESLLADPLLLRTPILRDGKKAVVGLAPEAWAAFAEAGAKG
jgi:arsenate reductase-like glutaredoxin family protein